MGPNGPYSFADAGGGSCQISTNCPSGANASGVCCYGQDAGPPTAGPNTAMACPADYAGESPIIGFGALPVCPLPPGPPE